MAGEAYRQPITAQGGTGTRIFSLSSGALPDGLVLNISTGELNGPLQTGTEGDYRFSIAMTDGTGATNAASYTLRVQTQAVAVVDKAVTVAPGEAPPNVYLNAGATGGPFVQADIVGVNPANAGTAQIIEGEVAALGVVRPRGFYLKFTPNPLFVGTATIDFTLTSALGISNTGTVSYAVVVDHKAVADKADRAVRDFVGARQILLSNHVAAPGLVERRLASQARERVSLDIVPNGNGMGVTVATSTAQLDAARRADDPAYAGTPMPLFNVWFDGTLMAHKQGSSPARSDDPLAIETGTGDDNGWGTFALLSAGADYLVSDSLLVGVAIHSDRMTDPGQGTSVEGTGVLVGPYASFALSPSLYLDASLLYGQSWNTVDLGDFEGSFGTTRLMATTKLEGIMSDGAWTLRPNLKLTYLTEDVDDYDVSGSAASVAVQGFTEDDLRFSSGLTVGYLLTMPNGLTLAPQIGGSIGLSSANGSDAIGDGLFGTIEARFTLAGEQGWALQAMGTMDLEREETQAIGGRISLSIPF
ncbi:autotransporter domain-containing protein [Aureimonas pseudogalii]